MIPLGCKHRPTAYLQSCNGLTLMACWWQGGATSQRSPSQSSTRNPRSQNTQVGGQHRGITAAADVGTVPSLLKAGCAESLSAGPVSADTLHRFCKKEHDWGWKKFMELSKVLEGFTVSNTLVIKAQVQVIRCVSQLRRANLSSSSPHSRPLPLTTRQGAARDGPAMMLCYRSSQAS